MTSLRARLVAGLLALAAAGLLIAGAVTYAEQRSFLQERIDDQARAATPALTRALADRGFGPDEHDRRGPGFGGGPNHGPGRDVNLPPGTYGQRRDASGKVLGSVVISYDQQAPAAPKIPASLEINQPRTVGSTSGLRYRVLASNDPGGAVTIVAVPLRELDQTLDRLLMVEGLVIAGVLLALGASAFFLVRLGLRPLDRMATVAGEIAGGRMSQRVEPADNRSEVGRLGLALNAMLGRLEKAFAERQASEDRLREFLADASHELRTPLASIRGYAEVFRMGAKQDPDAVETSMKRIEDESKRMGVLVEDLLTLARLDEVREAVRQPVDVREIARDAVDDARVTAPERDIGLDANGAASITADPHQVRQVIANLLRNALVHTPPGSPIEVAVRGDVNDVALEVRDHGPGLPDGPPERLFDRFWRSEAGRERGRAGAGLGLAIVAGIVDAHGGSVEAQNAQGGGARFVVRLPRDA